jgi:SNF2 family DNA or RNA helicase
MSTDIHYDLELNNESLRCDQPPKIKKQLKPHQLACLHKAVKMENEGTIQYHVSSQSYSSLYRDNYFRNNNHFTGNISISTNIGIFGDIVGYGKTLTALSLIAQNPLENIHINNIKTHSYHSNKAYNYFTAVSANKNIPNFDDMIHSTLIIVPRGPVYIQWEKTLKESTDLKYLAIDNLNYIKKYLPEYNKNNVHEIINFFNQYDVVLIKNTTIDVLFTHYHYYNDKSFSFIHKWKRIMVDECHDLINKIDTFEYLYLWLISGTYVNLVSKSTSSYSLYYNVREILKDEYVNFILVKCTKEFVRESFKLPPIVEKYYLCKLSRHLEIIKNFISPAILEKINANDISGAVKDLGGKNETEEGIVKLICADLNKDISNKVKEREYILSLDIPEDQKNNKIKNIENEINMLNEKLNNLTERISEINSKTCPICLDVVSQPVILECTHIFCGSCLISWMNNNSTGAKKCPECRTPIKSTEQLTAIVSENNLVVKSDIVNTENISKLGKGVLSKEESLLELIASKPNGKFLVFSRVDNGFSKIIERLNEKHIKYNELKGNTSHMMNVLNDFKNGQVKVILLNTQYAGSGIDISFATDVVIFHSMDVDKHQAIGRAQRVGRTESLFVHNLCYEHELQ